MNRYPDHLSTVPAYYRRHFGPSEYPGDLPDNPGCKVRIGATYQPAMRITPSVHTSDIWEPASKFEEAIWGCGLAGGFISFIFLSYFFFG